MRFREILYLFQLLLIKKSSMAKTKEKLEKKKKYESKKLRKLQNQRSKECMKKLRKQIRNDPVLHEQQKKRERERYLARKEAGKIKSICYMNDREKRKVRKQWRERSKKII
ncbi:unnamed protein product [Psylliodes chrysocephalus]|uniref:rRNA-processing protein FYV7 n=1 Tax=Psylliodes chrysocephalus TaxID=3402493 RepID=A0A9P0GDU5_9CUCU|nr:unnamed protein product [Psylliodes chrysocephala]